MENGPLNIPTETVMRKSFAMHLFVEKSPILGHIEDASIVRL